MNNYELAAKLLEKFRIDEVVNADGISDLKEYKAQQYALTKILSFGYKNRKFYISDDYSLDDNPAYVRDLIQDINHLIGGNIVKNPKAEADGAQYALGFNGAEYYLWEDLKAN